MPNEVENCRPKALLKRDVLKCFPKNFTRFFRIVFFIKYLGTTASEFRVDKIFCDSKKKQQQLKPR